MEDGAFPERGRRDEAKRTTYNRQNRRKHTRKEVTKNREIWLQTASCPVFAYWIGERDNSPAGEWMFHLDLEWSPKFGNELMM